ncbi:hypothetical protein FKM82_011699 [Ascaphus truei]
MERVGSGHCSCFNPKGAAVCETNTDTRDRTRWPSLPHSRMEIVPMAWCVPRWPRLEVVWYPYFIVTLLLPEVCNSLQRS